MVNGQLSVHFALVKDYKVLNEKVVKKLNNSEFGKKRGPFTKTKGD